VKLPVTFSVDVGDLVARALTDDDVLIDRVRDEFVAAVRDDPGWRRDLRAALQLAADDPMGDDELIAHSALAIQYGREHERNARLFSSRLTDVVEVCREGVVSPVPEVVAFAREVLRTLDDGLADGHRSATTGTAQMQAVPANTNGVPTPARGVELFTPQEAS
jgi:hypothetical protein